MADTSIDISSTPADDDFMLTTLDNPYNPFTQYDDWYRFDLEHGYDSCGLLARFAKTSPQLSPVDNDLEVERAIDRIVELFPLIYVKAHPTDSKYLKA